MRKLGSKDLTKRKKYKKRKVKAKSYSKRRKGNKHLLKLFIWIEEPMSKDGFNQFSSETKKYMRRIVFKPLLRIDAPVTEINTKKAIGEFIKEIVGYEGVFIIRSMSHGKTKTGFKWVRFAKVTLKEVNDEIIVMYVDLNDKRGINRAIRYKWFFKDE